MGVTAELILTLCGVDVADLFKLDASFELAYEHMSGKDMDVRRFKLFDPSKLTFFRLDFRGEIPTMLLPLGECCKQLRALLVLTITFCSSEFISNFD